MKNKFIEALSPGFYLVNGFFFFIEKTEDGKVYQLTPAGKRNGILSENGWNHDRRLLVTKIWAPIPEAP